MAPNLRISDLLIMSRQMTDGMHIMLTLKQIVVLIPVTGIWHFEAEDIGFRLSSGEPCGFFCKTSDSVCAGDSQLNDHSQRNGVSGSSDTRKIILSTYLKVIIEEKRAGCGKIVCQSSISRFAGSWHCVWHLRYVLNWRVSLFFSKCRPRRRALLR